MITASIQIPENEPFEHQHTIDLDISPCVGHLIADPNGNKYRITEIIHRIMPNQVMNEPRIKIIVVKVP